jgi:uncharacterized protein YfaS (alpha-2-macroglobulin family)
MVGGAFAQSAAERYATLQARAADYYSEQSYALAHQAWSDAEKQGVPPEDRQTLSFYLADSLWRSRPDAPQLAEARKQLEVLAGDKEALAAEAAESLGDSWLAIEKDWMRGWKDYERALKFWAASTDLDAARARYLAIVWKATGPPGQRGNERRVPLDVLANALRIAPPGEEQARAHYFLGRWYAVDGDPYSQRRAGREFQAAVEAGADTAVYESALFEWAEWNLAAGAEKWDGDRLVLGPDYGRALELFRRFEKEFPKGRSALTEKAVAQIAELTRPALELRAEHQFLPGTKPVVRATWRNVGEVQFTLSRVDLTRDFVPSPKTDPERWIDAVRAGAEGMVRQWKEAGPPAGSHEPEERMLRLEEIAEPGTYLLEALAGEQRARALIVVTQGAAVFQLVGDQVVAFLCDARTGDRAKEGGGILWRARETNRQWNWQSVEGGAATDGLLTFTLPKTRRDWSGSLLLFGRNGSQPVIASDKASAEVEPAAKWRVQTFTDRAAYRPGETVRWKVIARKRADGAYATPRGALVKFTVTSPLGEKVDSGEVKLTEFGGAWGDLPLPAEWPLGEYKVQFSSGEEVIAEETLFRLEEYRLPEFKVNVAVGDADRPLRLGEEFPVKVAAEYYFGGAVADAKVVVEVRESTAVRPLSLEDGDSGRVVQNETLRTGPDGTAEMRVSTPLDGRRDLRYDVTARVVDSSGREVTATGGVVVARQGYFVEMEPSRRVVQPKDTVKISVTARDGNNRPTAATGALTISRLRWTEVWRDPQGREVSGEELEKLKLGVFPPTEFGWRLVKQEYSREEVARDEVKTNDQGLGSYGFRPQSAGFYRVAWSSPDGNGPPVIAETDVWASATEGGSTGYRSGGVEIICDPSAPAGADKVPVLVTTDTANRDVLLLVHAGGNLFRSEVVHVDGKSKLVELERDPRYVPNVFVTGAAMRGLEFFADTREIKFPPVQNALVIDLRADAAKILPGGDGSLRLKVRDAEGAPVRGEFAVSVTDEAISAIQEDYTGSPVDFFLGESRDSLGDPVSSVSAMPFLRASDLEKDNARPLEKTMMRSMAGGQTAPQDVEPVALAEVAGETPVAVRSNFTATALWQPGIVTDEDGVAIVKFKYPDSLTTWRAVVRGSSAGEEFGFAETTTTATKSLIARMQAPRFLVDGDQVQIAAVVNNRTSEAIKAKTNLRVEGLVGAPRMQALEIPSGRDARAVWSLWASNSGVARLTLTAVADSANDGVAVQLPIFPDGIEQSLGVAGKATDATTKWDLTLPGKRRAGSQSLIVIATPSLAATALDALPYLVSYPHGCVEQTMSRFLPAAVTARTLQSLGLDRGVVANRIFGGVSPEFLAKTHPKMEGTAGLEELDAAIASGLGSLSDAQKADGSWGWWKAGESDAFMTAYVVWGLRLAQQAGVAVRLQMIDRGVAWLRQHLVDATDDPNLQAWLLHALAAQHEAGGRLADEERAALDNAWKKRDQLTAYGRALLTLAAQNFGDTVKAQTLVRNLRDGVVRDTQGGLPAVHWGSDGMFRAWQDGGVEATAFALQALLAVDPGSDLIEPAVSWLVKNRRGAQWSNTRDTAITVLAMDRYLAATKELGRAASFEIFVNGRKAAEARDVTALSGESRFPIDPSFLRDGANSIELHRTAGDGPVYLSAQARFFTQEQSIAAAGDEVTAERDYLRYAPQLTLLDGYRFDRIPWKLDEVAAPDQRIEVVLTIAAKNDLEYVMVEDRKPAGLEAVDVRSGEFLTAEGPDGRRVPVYCELRDRTVAFFLRRLPAGEWTIRYDLRTELAGDFSALPVTAQAMYATEIRGNGESRRVKIK